MRVETTFKHLSHRRSFCDDRNRFIKRQERRAGRHCAALYTKRIVAEVLDGSPERLDTSGMVELTWLCDDLLYVSHEDEINDEEDYAIEEEQDWQDKWAYLDEIW